MREFESYCEKLDTHEKLATLDMKADDLLFFKEGGYSFADDYGLDVNDIQFGFGKIYRKSFYDILNRGLEWSVLQEGKNIDTDIGRFMREINRLYVRVNSFKSLDVENPEQALESVINKIIVHGGYEERLELGGYDTSPSEACLEILKSTSYVTQELILKKGSKPEALLNKLEEPLMTTQLWNHQKEALMEWIKNDFTGYVDMATATGKTVLGLAALASLYGELHPKDQNELTKEAKKSEGRVLIVAHDHLVLEQWGREFDEHLQIPRKFTGLSEEKELTNIDLNWGLTEFVTSSKFENMIDDGLENISKYDLLILDEIHKYTRNNITNISPLIERNKIKILALSGSVDVDKTTRKEVRNRLNQHLSMLGRYTLEEAKDDGIIPEFSWHIVYTTPRYKGDEDRKLKETTKKCTEGFSDIQKHEEMPSFDGYEDAMDFGHTIEGKNLKEDFDIYNEYLTAINARKTRLWNLTPSFESMVDVIEEEAKKKKCLALVAMNRDVETLRNILKSKTDIDENNIWTIGVEDREAHEQRNIIDEFDSSDEPGVMIGTGKRLGVGVDFLNLEAVVNATSGFKVNKSLVQRMGRMLRNPEGEKENPVFYNFVPILENDELRITGMDGRQLIEGGSQYLGLADAIGSEPGKDLTFLLASEDLHPELVKIECGGREYIKDLMEKGSYREPSIIGKDSDDRKNSKTYLEEEILDAKVQEDDSILLTKWGKKEKDKQDRKTEKKKKVKVRKGKQTRRIQKESESSSLKKKIKGVFGKVKKKLKKD